MMNMSIIDAATEIVSNWFAVENIDLGYDRIYNAVGCVLGTAELYSVSVTDAEVLASVVIDMFETGINAFQIDYTESNFAGLHNFYFQPDYSEYFSIEEIRDAARDEMWR